MRFSELNKNKVWFPLIRRSGGLYKGLERFLKELNAQSVNQNILKGKNNHCTILIKNFVKMFELNTLLITR
jgi:hypothetical protein